MTQRDIGPVKLNRVRGTEEGNTLTGIQLSRYRRVAKKARESSRGKSAKFVPMRDIFFVRYNTEKKKRNYADEAR